MFRDLKPGSDERKQLWESSKAELRSLLEEINRDVFDNKGTIVEDCENNGQHGMFDPVFTKPNIVLEVRMEYDQTLHKHVGYMVTLGICTSSGKTFRIVRSQQYCYPNVIKEYVAGTLRQLLLGYL